MIQILPLITRAGAMLMLKLRAKRAARKKILKDAALKKKVDKIGKKAAKKEAKKKETKKKRETELKDKITIVSPWARMDAAAKRSGMPKKKITKRIMAIGKLKGKLSTKQVAARQKLRDDVKKYKN